MFFDFFNWRNTPVSTRMNRQEYSRSLLIESAAKKILLGTMGLVFGEFIYAIAPADIPRAGGNVLSVFESLVLLDGTVDAVNAMIKPVEHAPVVSNLSSN